MLVRLIIFDVPASCLWTLLPLVANERLNASTFEFVMLSGATGFGAVLALQMPLRATMSWNRFAALGSGAYSVVFARMAFATRFDVILVLTVVTGAAWVGVQSTWMTGVHSVLPPWIKARAIASL
ncbi:MFS transporter [Arthrobacter bambusae]|uniref:MFS transporter n=1 Tax=Arthrobacter bambusae TaxID=1338426 RepID=UPI00277DF557|nr:MFS transporter [Arthrobacter bambusae]MDQ0242124.1 hypothetical protein [Arthrobacter bambusae]